MTALTDPALIIEFILARGDGFGVTRADCSAVIYVAVVQICQELTGYAGSVGQPMPQWVHKWLYELIMAARAAEQENCW